ncbi:MAG: hypothetical protein GY721_14620 [Deltaproteobacteria bacterium]|nr:hypothetical protein [Deltaproteobacteria bacterium]
MSKIVSILAEVDRELRRATSAFPPFNSAHEGYAVLLEEVDELKEIVWQKTKARNSEQLRKEAIQAAAMAVRFVLDVCDRDETTSSRRPE